MGLFNKREKTDPVQEALENKKIQENQRKEREKEALQRKVNIKKKRKNLEITLSKMETNKKNIEKKLIESKLDNDERTYQLQKRTYLAVLSKESKMKEFLGQIDVLTEMHDISTHYQDFVAVVSDISKDMISMPEIPNIEELNDQIDLGVSNLNDMTKSIENLMNQMESTTESFFDNQDNDIDEDEIDKLVNSLIEKQEGKNFDDSKLLSDLDEIDASIKERIKENNRS